jgi:hypothetical protein
MADFQAALSGAGFGGSRSHEWASWRPHRRRPEIARAPYGADGAEHKPRAIIEQIRSFTAPLGCDATGEVASIRRRSPSRRLACSGAAGAEHPRGSRLHAQLQQQKGIPHVEIAQGLAGTCLRQLSEPVRLRSGSGRDAQGSSFSSRPFVDPGEPAQAVGGRDHRSLRRPYPVPVLSLDAAGRHTTAAGGPGA